MFCSNCGKAIADFSRFCPECGNGQANSQSAAIAPQLSSAVPVPVPQVVQPVGSAYAAQHLSGMSSVGTRDQQPRGNLIYPRNPPISPHLAWVSILICGLPQLVYGQVLKGILLFILCVILIPTVFGPPILVIVAIIDAYMIGNTLKAGRPVSKWACFPTAS